MMVWYGMVRYGVVCSRDQEIVQPMVHHHARTHAPSLSLLVFLHDLSPIDPRTRRAGQSVRSVGGACKLLFLESGGEIAECIGVLTHTELFQVTTNVTVELGMSCCVVCPRPPAFSAALHLVRPLRPIGHRRIVVGIRRQSTTPTPCRVLPRQHHSKQWDPQCPRSNRPQEGRWV